MYMHVHVHIEFMYIVHASVGFYNIVTSHLYIELDEEEKDNVLPLVLDGQVEGELRVSLEHVIEQRGTQLSKVTCVQVTLWVRGGEGYTCIRVSVCVYVCSIFMKQSIAHHDPLPYAHSTLFGMCNSNQENAHTCA